MSIGASCCAVDSKAAISATDLGALSARVRPFGGRLGVGVGAQFAGSSEYSWWKIGVGAFGVWAHEASHDEPPNEFISMVPELLSLLTE